MMTSSHDEREPPRPGPRPFDPEDAREVLDRITRARSEMARCRREFLRAVDAAIAAGVPNRLVAEYSQQSVSTVNRRKSAIRGQKP